MLCQNRNGFRDRLDKNGCFPLNRNGFRDRKDKIGCFPLNRNGFRDRQDIKWMLVKNRKQFRDRQKYGGGDSICFHVNKDFLLLYTYFKI